MFEGLFQPMHLLVIVGIALLAAFVWQERRAAEPLLPLQLFLGNERNFSWNQFDQTRFHIWNWVKAAARDPKPSFGFT